MATTLSTFDSVLDATRQIHSGFCAIIGRPNVGKSTLVNRLVGEKVAIVTPKPQTTRTRILGIVNAPEHQIILVDTPGLTTGTAPLMGALRRTASSAAADADVTLVVAEVRGHEAVLGEEDNAVLATARRGGGKVLLALNKIDVLPDKRWLLPWTEAYTKANDIEAVVPISARRGLGLDTLIEQIAAALPVGPALYDPETHTDQAERVLCAELVREQLLLRLQAEVPHSTHVIIEDFTDLRDDPKPLVRLEGRIIVERDSQKAIVIGAGGRTIRDIGTFARANIERMLGSQVYLRLTVHVDAKWTARSQSLREYGLMPERAP